MWRVHLALLSVQLLFGLWPVAGTAVMREMSPPALIGLRLALGAPLLVLVAGLPWRRLPSRRDLLSLAGLAALGISVNQLLFAEGLHRAGPINASITILLIPAVSLGVGTVLGLEKPSRARLTGIAIALLGAAILLGVERIDLGDRRFVGNLMLVTNASVYALYLVLARPVIARLGSLNTVAWVFVLGALEAAPLTVKPVLSVHWLSLPAATYGALVFVLFGATLGTYLLNAYALRRVESSVVAVYVYLQPVIATVASWALLGIVPTRRALVAAIVIIAGVAVSADLPAIVLRRWAGTRAPDG